MYSIPVGNSISGFTGSPSSLTTARIWLENCVTNHSARCSNAVIRDQSPRWLPTRILFIGTKSDPYVRLLDTLGLYGSYACLSYCWGGVQSPRTTRNPDTLSQYNKGIPWSTLPKTFQEVISVVRELSIQLLWVDSLCIIQNDQNDWQEQMRSMASIYRNSMITIGASMSANPNAGLFSCASPNYVDQSLADVTGKARFQPIRIRNPLSHEIGKQPLLRRAWAFQEWLLSPRYLHFGANELLWECMECRTCECRLLPFSPNYWCLKTAWQFEHSWLTSLTPSQLGIYWHAAVQSYSGMNLTYESDVLPAISGVARLISMASGSPYVAALWRHWLIEDLMWTVQNPWLAQRPSRWRSPTFSWASVSAKNNLWPGVVWNITVKYQKSRGPMESWGRIVHSRVLEVNCVHSGPDKLGQIASAYLVLSGPLAEGTRSSAIPDFRCWPDYDYAVSGSYDIPLDTNVHCLKLVTFFDPSWRFQVYLMLRKIKDEDCCGVFERIGLLGSCCGRPNAPRKDYHELADQPPEAVVKII